MLAKFIKSKEGFTLIELLVVIAIIGLLSSVVLASLSGARESARDTRRVQDFRQLRTAVNMHLNDTGSYPGGGDEQVSENCTGTSLYQDLVDGGYLQSMITDPAETTVSCSLHVGSSNEEGEYYYGWDSENTGRNNCFSIQNFESSDDAGALENIDQSDETSFGGGGGMYNADFVYCFD